MDPMYMPKREPLPYLEIVEEPQSKGFRFRYECEGKSHGGLQGVNSQRDKKSYPAVRVVGYKGPAKIIVSLVMDEKYSYPHPHELVGKNCVDGKCIVKISGDNMTVNFPNLGVRHITKKLVPAALEDKLKDICLTKKQLESGSSFQCYLTEEEEKRIKELSQQLSRDLKLNVVRLKFDAYLLNHSDAVIHVLEPVFSSPIHDSKAPCASVLKICRMDKVGGCCQGGDEVFLLCDKVQKDDISVRFYEQDEDFNLKWESHGLFSQHDVHRQYAIVFKTPAYGNKNITEPVSVQVQLVRKSNGDDVSDPKTFTYYPMQNDMEGLQLKRKKQIPNSSLFNMSVPSRGVSGAVGGLNNEHGAFNGSCELTGNRQSTLLGHQPHNLAFSSSLGISSNRSVTPCDASRDYWCYDMSDSSLLVPHGIQPIQQTKEPDPENERHSNEETDAGDKETHNDLYTTTLDETCASIRDLNISGGGYHGSLPESSTNRSKGTLLAMSVAKRLAAGVHQYAKTGDVICLLIPARHLLKAEDENGDNALHLSIIHEQPIAAKNILKALNTLPTKREINKVNGSKQPPLFLSLVTRQIDILEALLLNGANYRYTDSTTGDSLFHICARFGYDEGLSRLLERWSKETDRNPSHINSFNYEGYSALHLAVLAGNLNCVKLLASNGDIDVNKCDGKSGQTPLHHAVAANNVVIAGYLVLECDVDLDVQSFDGNTALHLAVLGQREGIVALLMAAGADPDIDNYSRGSNSDDDDSLSEDLMGTVDSSDRVESGIGSDEMFGKTPRDYAHDNERIKRLLSGESYTQVKNDDPRQQSTELGHVTKHDSGITDSLLSNEKGDINKLNKAVREELSKLLNVESAGRDWKAVADHLGCSSLIGAFEEKRNPTVSLIDTYEVFEGTILALKDCLKKLNRDDAVDVINRAMKTTLSH